MLSGLETPPMPATKRPNILFLMTDQHRYDMAGFMGNDIVRTPRLDALAQQATVFDQAYTPSPICVPARPCIMAGQMPRTCNCEGTNNVDLTPFYHTFAKHFAEHGYRTVCAGKLHHQGQDQMQGWTTRISGLNEINVYPQNINFAEGFSASKRNRGWDVTKEVRCAGPGTSPWIRRDEYSLEGALDYIDYHFNDIDYDRCIDGEPLLLKLSLTLPHYPFKTSRELMNYYINRVPFFDPDAQQDYPEWAGTLCKSVNKAAGINAREAQRAMACYYGMVETCDQMFGQIIDRLEQAGQNLDDWLIIFTADHGDMMGDKGVWFKQSFFDGSARVPLFIRPPASSGRTAGRVSQNVSLCDLYATMCDVADLPIPDGLDSRSLAPFLNGNTPSDWPDECWSQFSTDDVMIKRGDLKYCYYAKQDQEVLFNLANDPQETHSAIDDPTLQGEIATFRTQRQEWQAGRQLAAC